MNEHFTPFPSAFSDEDFERQTPKLQSFDAQSELNEHATPFPSRFSEDLERQTPKLQSFDAQSELNEHFTPFVRPLGDAGAVAFAGALDGVLAASASLAGFCEGLPVSGDAAGCADSAARTDAPRVSAELVCADVLAGGAGTAVATVDVVALGPEPAPCVEVVQGPSAAMEIANHRDECMDNFLGRRLPRIARRRPHPL